MILRDTPRFVSHLPIPGSVMQSWPRTRSQSVQLYSCHTLVGLGFICQILKHHCSVCTGLPPQLLEYTTTIYCPNPLRHSCAGAPFIHLSPHLLNEAPLHSLADQGLAIDPSLVPTRDSAATIITQQSLSRASNDATGASQECRMNGQLILSRCNNP